MFSQTHAAESVHRTYDKLESLARLIKIGALIVTAINILVLLGVSLGVGLTSASTGPVPVNGIATSSMCIVGGLGILQTLLYGVLIYAAGEALEAFRHLVINSHRTRALLEQNKAPSETGPS